MLREWAGTALLWILGQEQECELECSPEGAAESEEIFPGLGGVIFAWVKSEVMKHRHSLILL